MQKFDCAGAKTCKMDAPIYHPREPPYVWLRAYEYPERKKYKFRKQQCLARIAPEMPYYTLDDVKIVKVTTFELDSLFEVGIYKSMAWSVFKGHIFQGLKEYKDKMKFNYDSIKDIKITNSPYEMSPAIDDTKHDLFTVIADNAIVFLSQLNIDGSWIFFK